MCSASQKLSISVANCQERHFIVYISYTRTVTFVNGLGNKVVSRRRHCIPIDIYYTTHVLVFDNTVYVYNILTTPLYLYQRIAQHNIYSQPEATYGLF